MERNVRPREDHEKSRMESIRRAEERAQSLRQNMNMLPVSPLFIPPEWQPHGWEYTWVRIGWRNGKDYTNETNALAGGYTPVPAERHPQLMRRFTNDTPNHVQGCIVYQELMLCEIPKVFKDDIRDTYYREEFERTHNMNALKTGLGFEPTMPGMIFSNNLTRSAA